MTDMPHVPGIEEMLVEADDLLLKLGRIRKRRARLKRLVTRRIEKIKLRNNLIDGVYESQETETKLRLELLHKAIRQRGGAATYALPSGRLAMSVVTRWEWPEDDDALVAQLQQSAPKLLRVTYAPDKVTIKKVAKLGEDGILVPNSEGEWVPIAGVVVTTGVDNYHPKPDDDIEGEIELDEADESEGDEGE